MKLFAHTFLLTILISLSLTSAAFCGKVSDDPFDSNGYEYSQYHKYYEYYEKKRLSYLSQGNRGKSDSNLEKTKQFFSAYFNRYRGSVHEENIAQLQLLVKEDDAQSLMRLAEFYIKGERFSNHIDNTLFLLKKASSLGNSDAKVLLKEIRASVGQNLLKTPQDTHRKKRKAINRSTIEDPSHKGTESSPNISNVIDRDQIRLKTLRNITTHLPRKDQAFDELPLPFLTRIRNILKKDTPISEVLKSWLVDCPSERLGALIPTLEVLVTSDFINYDAYDKLHAKNEIDKLRNGRLAKTGSPWISEEAYQKLRPYHLKLLQQSPNILSQLHYELHTKRSLYHLVYLKEKECTWLSGIIPAQGTGYIRETKLSRWKIENNDFFNFISRFLVNSKDPKAALKLLQDYDERLPQDLKNDEQGRWDRFVVLGFIAVDFDRLQEPPEIKDVYATVIESFLNHSFFSRAISGKYIKIKTILEKLALDDDIDDKKQQLLDIKEILDSRSDWMTKLRGIEKRVLGYTLPSNFESKRPPSSGIDGIRGYHQPMRACPGNVSVKNPDNCYGMIN